MRNYFPVCVDVLRERGLSPLGVLTARNTYVQLIPNKAYAD